MSSDLYTSNIDSDTYGDLFLEMVECGKLRLVAIGPGNEGGASFQFPANPEGWKEAENLIGALREWVNRTKEIHGVSEEIPKVKPVSPPSGEFILVVDCDGDPQEVFSGNANLDHVFQAIHRLDNLNLGYNPHSAWRRSAGGFTRMFERVGKDPK